MSSTMKKQMTLRELM